MTRRAINREKITLGDTKISIVGDCDADTSWLGQYSDTPKPGSIIRETGEFIEDLPEDEELPQRGREYRFFHPYAAGERIGSDDYRKYGKRDYDRMESLNAGQWCFVGVEITTDVIRKRRSDEYPLIDIARASIWGIESDADRAYMKSVIDDLKSELRVELLQRGATSSQITKSFKNAIEVE
jgi:hypothetical protein